MPPYKRRDISDTPYHVKDIKAFGEILDEAARAAFPNRGAARYKEVHVLLLSWEDDNLGVINEVIELEAVFRDRYHYQTEVWAIPSERSHNTLAGKIVQFLNDYESEDNLLITYYGGHGEMNDDRQCVWLCLVQMRGSLSISILGRSSLQELSTNIRFHGLGAENKTVKERVAPWWFPKQMVKAGNGMECN